MKRLIVIWLCAMLMLGSSSLIAETTEDAQASTGPLEQIESAALSVLLVDADTYNENLVSYYDSACTNYGATVTIWDVFGHSGPAQGKPIAVDMVPYNVVIWIPDREMNWDGSPFNPTDEAEVATYLDGGGENFLLSNIAWTDFTDGGSCMYSTGDFAYDYMGLTSINAWSGNEWSVNGTVGDPIYGGFGPAVQDWSQGGWGGFSPWSSDDISGITTDCTYGIWNDDGFGMIAPGGAYYDGGTFRTVFWGFPYETIPSPYSYDLMNRTLDWFSSTPGIPQITLSKSAPPSANPGDTIEYMITYQNIGDGLAQNVVLSELYPVGVTYLDANPVPTIGDNVWVLGDLPSGSNGTIFINVSVDLSTLGLITNWGYLDYDNAVGDPQPQESANADTMIIDPLMTVSKYAPATANPGELLTYLINYTNNGSDWAYNVNVTETYPVGVTFVSAIPVPDVPDNVWTIPAVPPGGNDSIEIVVQVNVDVLMGTLLTNVVALDYENGAGIGYQTGDSASTNIIGPLMVFSKQAPETVDPVGEIILYELFYSNFGIDSAYNVMITESYPTNVTFISAIPPPDIGNNTWLIGTVQPAAVDSIQITMQVDISASGSLINFAQLDCENQAGIPQAPINDTATTYIIEGDYPIRINSNSDFDPAHGITDGNGTAINPWIIEGYNINGTNRGNCIYVGNTTEHFIVRDCHLHHANGYGYGTWPFYGDIGLILYNVTNGRVEHNVVEHNQYRGIYLYEGSCDNIVIFNNATDNVQSGIHISNNSHNNLVYSNNVSNNDLWGIIIYNSMNNNVEANTVHDNADISIYLSESSNNTIDYNDCLGGLNNYGIKLGIGSDGNNITNNTCVNNLGQGISIESSNFTYVYNNDCIGNGNNGIYLNYAHDNTILENNCSDNIDNNGISLDLGCYNNFISDNSLYDNFWHGIRLDFSNINTIKNNDFHGNTIGLFIISSNGNLIYHNNFLGNVAFEAYNEGVNNWDNGYPSGGNFWIDYSGVDLFSGPGQDIPGSDGIGDTNYTNIMGDFAVDNYPLMGRWGYYPQPSMNLTKWAPDLATPGEIITYWINYTNQGDDWAYNIVIVENYPSGVTFISAIPPPSIGDNIWDQSTIPQFAAMAPGANGSIEITVTVDPGVPWGTWLVNNVTVDYSNATGDPMQDRTEAWTFIGLQRDITLQSGWNLISLPLVQSDTAILAVLSSIDGKWDIAQYYNAVDINDHWKSYSTFKPPQLNDLLFIDHLMGFWLHTTEVCTLETVGIPAISSNIQLYAGWNMVGYPTLNNTMTVGESLWGTGADIVEVCDLSEPYNLREVGPEYIMQPGEGYWVHVPVDTTWTIDW